MPYKKILCSKCYQEFRPKTIGQSVHNRCPKSTVTYMSQKWDWKRTPVPAAEGRPWNDPRNNFPIPLDKGPKRDLLTSPIRIAVFDIETTSLDASFGRALCAVFQFFSPDERVTIRADEFDAFKSGRRADDSEVVQKILHELEKADILVAHNGVRFDMRFIRTRALVNRLQPVEPRMIVDPVWLARRNFRFHSNSLEALSTTLGTGEKTHLNPNVWVEAYGNGDKQAMDYIVEHCERDVDVLCETAKLFQPYVQQIDRIGSFRQ